MKTAVMFVWFLIFQHASISLFPKEPQTPSQTTPSLGLWKSSVWCHVFQSDSCRSRGTTLTISPRSVTARQVVNMNFKFPDSSAVVEGAANHPHSSVPPSPHPQDLLLPRHSSIHSAVLTRMCFL